MAGEIWSFGRKELIDGAEGKIYKHLQFSWKQQFGLTTVTFHWSSLSLHYVYYSPYLSVLVLRTKKKHAPSEQKKQHLMLIKPPKLPVNQLTDQYCLPSIAKNSSVTSSSSWSSYVNKPSDIDGEICTFPPLFQIKYNVRLMNCLYRPHSNLRSTTYNSPIDHHQLMSIYFGFIYKYGYCKIHDLFYNIQLFHNSQSF